MPTVLVALSEGEDARKVASFVNTFFRSGEFDVIGINIAAEPTSALTPEVGFGVLYPWHLREDLAAVEAEQRERSERHAESVVVASGLRGGEAIGGVGNPVEQIIAAANEREVDLIVVGASHGGMLTHLFSPSVERALSQRAHRPLLIVP